MTEYVVMLERGTDSWGVRVPDLPGCVAVGSTREEAERLISEAIEMHLEMLRQSGDSVPEPRTVAASVTAS